MFQVCVKYMETKHVAVQPEGQRIKGRNKRAPVI
jgi:hypothetical protein